LATATGWENAEYRSFQFADPKGDLVDAHLVETPESLSRRESSTTRPTETEQRELRSIYYRIWGGHLKWKPH